MLCGVVVGALLASACSVLSPDGNLDGRWSGTTSQGQPISITIANHRVTQITVGYRADGCSGTKVFSNLSVALTLMGPSAGSLTFTEGSPNESNYTVILGSFTKMPDGRNATTLGKLEGNGFFTGTNYAECSEPFFNAAWHATKK
jgi:hypothetical protein